MTPITCRICGEPMHSDGSLSYCGTEELDPQGVYSRDIYVEWLECPNGHAAARTWHDDILIDFEWGVLPTDEIEWMGICPQCHSANIEMTSADGIVGSDIGPVGPGVWYCQDCEHTWR